MCSTSDRSACTIDMCVYIDIDIDLDIDIDIDLDIDMGLSENRVYSQL